MAVTAPANVPDWIPGAIIAAFYDRVGDPNLTLTSLAARFGELEGRAGEEISVPYAEATTPADNLAVNVPATDDALTSGAYTLTIKEGVKSIAWYDRTQVQSGQDVNAIAGQRVGSAMEARIELDLGAALVAGRDTADDAFSANFDLSVIRAMRKKIPSRLRRNGLVVVGQASAMDLLFDDAIVLNSNTFGSDEVLREGAFSRPLLGVTPYVVDDGVLPDITVAANPASPPVVMFARGMLAYAFQKNPSVETERDARARLTRHVGTMLHGEGTLEADGIVATAIGNA